MRTEGGLFETKEEVIEYLAYHQDRFMVRRAIRCAENPYEKTTKGSTWEGWFRDTTGESLEEFFTRRGKQALRDGNEALAERFRQAWRRLKEARARREKYYEIRARKRK